MTFDIWTLGILGAIGILLAVALGVFFFIFWVSMLVDCLKRRFKNDNDKLVWTLVIIFVGLLGAVIYYFVVKEKR